MSIDVAAMYTMNHTATICLGSNVGDAHDKIRQALTRLIDAGWSPVECSDIYHSSSGYLNQIVVATVRCGYEEALMTTKSVERMLGRRPEQKQCGIVPIDIDIVVWNAKVIRRLDFESEYFKQGLTLM